MFVAKVQAGQAGRNFETNYWRWRRGAGPSLGLMVCLMNTVSTRETREGWPLLTVAKTEVNGYLFTEVNGDSKFVPLQDIFGLPWLCPVLNIFFLTIL